MRRRDLLAMVAAGAGALTAGCGYAYGGGDVREETRIGYTVLRDASFHDLVDDGLVYAESDHRTIWEDDEATFTDATEVTALTRGGRRRWSHTHDESSVGMAAAGDDAYLLDGTEALVAVGPADGGSGRATDEYEAVARWRADLQDARPPLAADERGAYVAREGGLQAVREGSVAWDVDLPGTPGGLVTVEGGVAAATPGAVVGVTADGDDGWRVETDGVASVAAGGGRIAIGEGDAIEVVRATDGQSLWSADVGRTKQPVVTDGTVYVTAHGRVRALEAASGDERWSTGRSVGAGPPLVPAPEGAYAVRARCEAVAVDGDGVRWRRELDVEGGCGAVEGWLHGETVAFLFDSGEVRWLQRTDQPAPGSV